MVSRFALNFPLSDWLGSDSNDPPKDDWDIEQVPYPGEPNRPRVMKARRAFQSADGSLWDIRIRLVADWSNLPFISARNPYIDLFRTPETETPLPSPHGELSLYTFDRDGNPIFRSSETVLTLDPESIRLAENGRVWVDRVLDGQEHHVLLFSDPEYVYALSYQGKRALGYVSEIVGWSVLAAALSAIVLAAVLLIGMAAGHTLLSPRDIWAGVGTSFYGKLFVAFVLLALVPTIALAVLARGVVVHQLERDVEQEGMAQAGIVERFVWDYLLYRRMDASERGVAAVDDSFLEWVGGLVDSDVDLYSRGELVATSKRELFASGLLPIRAVPTVFREIVLERANYSIHREAVGSFEYLVVSMPIALERWGEPGILSLPLASRQREINGQVATLNQTVLLAAICFSFVAAILAYSLARRIAEPINTLTAATRRVAQGDFDVVLSTPSQDEIGALSTSFSQMTSDLKRQREHLERTKKLEAWAEMARQVAHEVKNPLTPIQLSTEHLRRVYDDDAVDFKEVLNACTETVLQQVRTLRQISMEFSTFANPAPIEPEPTDFGSLVSETMEPYRQSPPPGVTFDLTVEDSLPRVSVDRRLIQRTLVNLIENAFHALNGDGKVTVVVRPAEFDGVQWVEVAVSDTGAGIEPELHERIFEPYFSTRAGGTGLGLAISRKVVEEHGGTVTLESEPGKGTSVHVRLPAESVEPPASGQNRKAGND
jgi:signal transduction histidine kinase